MIKATVITNSNFDFGDRPSMESIPLRYILLLAVFDKIDNLYGIINNHKVSLIAIRTIEQLIA